MGCWSAPANSDREARLLDMSDTGVHQELWGAETRKAIENFPISGEPIPTARWLGRIKAAAARVNGGELGLLDAGKAERIAAAADRVAQGEFDDQFPVDVFQTGSGTSSNMNANEVGIASLAGEDIHPNDDVDIRTVDERRASDRDPSRGAGGARGRLLPALDGLARAFEAKSLKFDDVVKAGRTHWIEPCIPIDSARSSGGSTSGSRRAGPSRVDPRASRPGSSRRLVGTGLNTHRNTPAGYGPHCDRDRPDDPGPTRRLRGTGKPRRARRGLRCARDGRRLTDEGRQRPSLPRLRTARGPGGDLPSREAAAERLLDHARESQSRHSGGGYAGRGPGDRQRHRRITVGGMQGHFELNTFSR